MPSRSDQPCTHRPEVHCGPGCSFRDAERDGPALLGRHAPKPRHGPTLLEQLTRIEIVDTPEVRADREAVELADAVTRGYIPPGCAVDEPLREHQVPLRFHLHGVEVERGTVTVRAATWDAAKLAVEHAFMDAADAEDRRGTPTTREAVADRLEAAIRARLEPRKPKGRGISIADVVDVKIEAGGTEVAGVAQEPLVVARCVCGNDYWARPDGSTPCCNACKASAGPVPPYTLPELEAARAQELPLQPKLPDVGSVPPPDYAPGIDMDAEGWARACVAAEDLHARGVDVRRWTMGDLLAEYGRQLERDAAIGRANNERVREAPATMTDLDLLGTLDDTPAPTAALRALAIRDRRTAQARHPDQDLQAAFGGKAGA